VAEAVVIIGVGNRDRGDDGAGRRAAAALRAIAPPDVLVVESDGDPETMMAAWEGADRVVVIDAMVSGAPPGTIRRFDTTTRPLPACVRIPSTHSRGAVEAIELARSLGRLPGRTLVYGIEGVSFGAGTPMSRAVADAATLAASMVLAEVAHA
jgi:hydrogenase maturation protease